MIINSFQGGFDKNLSYLVWCGKTKLAAIVDPSVEINPIIEAINQHNLILDKILITHTHHDHIAYLDDCLYLYPNIQILCYHKSNLNAEFKGIFHDEIIALGQELIICLHTPGHYYDSMCFWNKDQAALFTGDTIFVGRTGRTISNRSSINDLYNSVYNTILKLPMDTVIYPGHHYGYKKSITINENIRCSKFFTSNSLDEFIKTMKDFESYQ